MCTDEDFQDQRSMMVRAYAMVTSLSNGRGNVREGKGGCIRMAKEKSALGPTSKTPAAPNSTMQGPRLNTASEGHFPKS